MVAMPTSHILNNILSSSSAFTYFILRVGGKAFGVAKNLDRVEVNVFGADGKSRFSVSALGYVIDRKAKKPMCRWSLLSLGTERKAVLFNKAVDKAVKAGIPVEVAVGDGGKNSCTYSPASAKSAITVAASTVAGYRLSYSNWGRCVDLYAPGENIWSAWSEKGEAGSFQTCTSSAAHMLLEQLLYILNGIGV